MDHAPRIVSIAWVSLGALTAASPALSASWNTLTVDSIGDVGTYASLELTAQHEPRAVYADRTTHQLKYASRVGGVWTFETIVAGAQYSFCSLALDAQGKPHVCFYDETAGALRYATRPGVAWIVETVDVQAGQYASLALDSQGSPRVSYLALNTLDLRYASRQLGVWTVQTVDSLGSVGSYTSLALDSFDQPHIAYRDFTVSDLKYARRAGPNWLIEPVDLPGNTGFYAALRLDPAGIPHIAYFDATLGDLRWAARTGAPWVTQTVDALGTSGQFCSVAFGGDGRARIAYSSRPTGLESDLRVATRTGATWTFDVVDTVGSTGLHTSIEVEGDSLPKVCYYDDGEDDFKYGEYDGFGDQCTIERAWRRGPKIQIVRELQHYPSFLGGMRPGDVISFSILAEDKDYLVQTCKDCFDQEQVRKWGPYSDLMSYEWALRGGGAGELILPFGPERTAILFQLPRCDWEPGQRREAVIDLTIANDSTTLKTKDPPYAGTVITIGMTMACEGRNPGSIDCTVNVSPGSSPPDEVISEGGPGTCVPQPPVWMVGDPISPYFMFLDTAPRLCPQYVVLVSAEADDLDTVDLKCEDPQPNCGPVTSRVTSEDPLDYTWSIASGNGSFPMGNKGRVVAFRPSTKQSALLRCDMRDSQTQFTDDPKNRTRSVPRSEPPKALVALGNNLDPDGRVLSETVPTAKLAIERLEDAGYEVDYRPHATLNTIDSLVSDPCYQAIHIIAHGKNAKIDLNALPGAADGYWGSLDLRSLSVLAHACEVHPYLLSLTLSGCDTYDTFWRRRLTCGHQVYMFDYKQVDGYWGWVSNRSPLKWTRDWFRPMPSHNFAFE